MRRTDRPPGSPNQDDFPSIFQGPILAHSEFHGWSRHYIHTSFI